MQELGHPLTATLITLHRGDSNRALVYNYTPRTTYTLAECTKIIDGAGGVVFAFYLEKVESARAVGLGVELDGSMSPRWWTTSPLPTTASSRKSHHWPATATAGSRLLVPVSLGRILGGSSPLDICICARCDWCAHAEWGLLSPAPVCSSVEVGYKKNNNRTTTPSVDFRHWTRLPLLTDGHISRKSPILKSKEALIWPYRRTGVCIYLQVCLVWAFVSADFCRRSNLLMKKWQSVWRCLRWRNRTP